MTGARMTEGAAEAAKRRSDERRNEFGRAKGLHEGLSRRSGHYSIGRDEEGMPKETRRLSGFPMIIDRWYVRMAFKHEDRKKLEGASMGEIESLLKKGLIPRKVTKCDTHIIIAVRALKRVRKSYEAELAETDSMLAGLDEANFRLASIKSRHGTKELGEALGALRSAESWLSAKKVAVKRVVALGRVQDAIRKLEEASAMPQGGRRDLHVGRALAVFTSVRNRLGAWRDKQVAGLVEYNLQKECALRAERDRWLLSRLARFAESTEAIHGFRGADAQRVEALDDISRLLRKRDYKEPVLSCMKDKHTLFRVSKRQRERAEQMIALAESGTQPRVGMNIDYMIGHYAWLYRYVSKGEKDKAREKLEHLRLFVSANKPSFVLAELGKEPDPYLGPVLEPLSAAVEAFENGEIAPARASFAKARAALAPFVKG
jgi:hypothetical protein